MKRFASIAQRFAAAILVLAGLPGCASPGSSVHPGPDLADILASGPLDTRLIPMLRRCESECIEEEQPHARAFREIIDQQAALRASPANDLESLKRIVEKFPRALPDARLACQYLIAGPMSRGHQGLAIFNSCARAFSGFASRESQEFTTSMILSLDHAVAIGATSPESDELHGLLLEEGSGADAEAEALHAYSRCLQADPARKSCQNSFRKASEKFLRPTCRVLPELNLRLVDGKPEDTLASPGISSVARVSRLELGEVHFDNKPTLLPVLEDFLQFQLDAPGTRKLARLTHSPVRGRLAIQLGSRPIATPFIEHELTDGRFILSHLYDGGIPNAIFEGFCPRDPALRLPVGLYLESANRKP